MMHAVLLQIGKSLILLRSLQISRSNSTPQSLLLIASEQLLSSISVAPTIFPVMLFVLSSDACFFDFRPFRYLGIFALERWQRCSGSP